MLVPVQNPVKPRDLREGWVVLALGSNLGDRSAHLARARTALTSAGLRPLALSAIHETAPVGGPPGQGPFLNQVVAASLPIAELHPHALLALDLEIERACGRVRRERFGPRTLDIDILLFGEAIVVDPDLVVPHPRMLERLFVLEPLCEILPTLRHPATRRTMREHLADLRGA